MNEKFNSDKPLQGVKYHPEFKDLVRERPFLLRDSLELISKLQNDGETMQSQSAEGDNIEVTFLAQVNELDRKYYKFTYTNPQGHTQSFFVKVINDVSGGWENGVEEFVHTSELRKLLLDYEDRKVKVIDEMLGLTKNNRSYFISRWNQDLIRDFKPEDFSLERPELVHRVQALKSFLSSHGYEDLSLGNMGYDQYTDELVVFDMTK